MLEHFFNTQLTSKQIAQVRALPQKQSTTHFTPAYIEQLCAEHETIDGLLQALLFHKEELF